MASLGHVAVGMTAARQYEERLPQWSVLALWSALSILPDIDVIGFALGIPYSAPWGHRGVTHSFVFSLVVGAAVGFVAARRRQRPMVRTALCASAVLASHPVLDTMTDGGLGCALLWPIDLTRYFAPWRPIQVAPIGPGLLSAYGVMVGLSELVLFFPLFAFALRPDGGRPRRIAWAITLAIWLAAAWLVASGDPIRDATVAALLGDSTVYASGFSEARFSTLAVGQSQTRVRQEVGTPLEVAWRYPRAQGPCAAVYFENDVVSRAVPPDACGSRGVGKGASKDDVEGRLGAAPESCWAYSRGAPGRAFRLRLVCFNAAKAAMVGRRWVLSAAR
jgi:inner membrane protein